MTGVLAQWPMALDKVLRASASLAMGVIRFSEPGRHDSRKAHMARGSGPGCKARGPQPMQIKGVGMGKRQASGLLKGCWLADLWGFKKTRLACTLQCHAHNDIGSSSQVLRSWYVPLAAVAHVKTHQRLASSFLNESGLSQ